MPSLRRAVARLRRSFVEGDDLAAILGDILADYGEESLAALLTIPELPEEAIHERYTLAHAVESFPDEIYVQTLLKSIPGMTAACPRFRDFLLARVVRSESCFAILMREVPSLAPEVRSVLRSLLKRMAADSKESPENRNNCRAALKLLNRRM
jgi:hypothetical protein